MTIIACSHNLDAEPSSGYRPLPAGEYTLEIVESDYVVTSKGTGMVLKCKATVVGGDYDQRPYYLNYNLENDNEIAVEIGQRDFAGLRRATGVLAPDDSEELHFIKFRVKIGIKARKDTGELENVVKEYLFDDEGDLDAEPLGAGGHASGPASAAASLRRTPNRRSDSGRIGATPTA